MRGGVPHEQGPQSLRNLRSAIPLYLREIELAGWRWRNNTDQYFFEIFLLINL